MAQQWNENHAYGNSFQHNGHVFGNVNHYGGNAPDLKKQIMESLYFPGMESRRLDAYDGTYRWIFDDKKTTFKEWISARNTQRFWIHGKAGSGKSTLMKAISQATCELAASRKKKGTTAMQLIVAEFFSWSAGSTEEKTLLGLLRSILYQLLEKCTVSIEEICPGRCKSISRAGRPPPPWDTPELLESVKRVVQLCHDKCVFLFLLDGLDELDESKDAYDLVRTLNKLIEPGVAKVCVSSRSWNVFEDEYRDAKWQVAVHEHNEGDIAQFVIGKLHGDLSLVSRSKLDEYQLSAISDLIRSRAAGVFFWVVLAVRSTRQGFTEGDNFRTLRERIVGFPKELGDFLRQIFEKIDPIYRKHTARTLILIRVNHNEVMQLAMLEDAGDPGFAIRAKVEQLTDEGMRKHLRAAESTVRKWCKDLVTIRDSSTGYKFAVFCHSSVKDFVDQRTTELLEEAGADFNVQLIQLRVTVRFLKHLGLQSFVEIAGVLFKVQRAVLKELCSHWSEDLTDIQHEMLDLLQEVNRIGEHLSERHAPASKVHWTSGVPTIQSVSLAATSFDYLGLLLKAKLEAPFWAILDREDPQETQQTRDFWLEFALDGLYCATIDTVQRLIERGADVNARCRHATPAFGPAPGIWQRLLLMIQEDTILIKPRSTELSTIAPKLRSSVQNQPNIDLLNTLNVVKLLLKHGCDPNVLLPERTAEASVLWLGIFSDALPELKREVKPFQMRIRDLFDPAKVAVTCFTRAAQEEWKWFHTEMTAAFNEASKRKQQQMAS